MLAVAASMACTPSADDSHVDSDVVDDSDVDSPGDTDPTDETDTTRDTDGRADTDSDTPVDSDAVDDTDTDRVADTDLVVDTAPPVRVARPPAVFTGAFVDLSAPWRSGGPQAFPVDPGQPGTNPSTLRTPQAVHLFLAELDGDDVQELIVASRGEDSAFPQTARVFHVDAGLATLTYDAALTALVTEVAGVMPVGFVDVDADGHGDLIFGRRAGFARLWNGAGFDPMLQIPVPWTRPSAFTAGIAEADLDHDGLLDLLVPEQDCAGSALAWHHTGGGHFVVRDLVPASAVQQQMCCLQAYTGEDGRDVILAQGPSCDVTGPQHAGFLVADGRDAEAWPVLVARDLTGPDAFWRTSPITGGGPYTLASPMGSALADLDEDGRLDLLLSLGSSYLNVSHGRRDGTFSDVTVASDMRLWNRAGSPTITDFPWSLVTVDLDQDGLTDVITATGDDVTSFRVRQGGPSYRPAAWRNVGDGTFVEITNDIGLGILGNWESLVAADPDGDGDADLFLGGWGQTGRLLRNDLDAGHHGFSLSLRGTTSNPLGLGATVDVTVTGQRTQHHVMLQPGSASPVVDPILFVGLGTADVARTVRITWPSGTVQVVHDLAAGTRHTITEPVSLAVDPPSRHLPADGASVATLTITPRAPDGSARVASTVVVRTLGTGQGTVGPVVGPDADGAWTVTLTAPWTVGSQVVEVEVDGVAMGVRPRVWWE
ncbi:MAG: VCBS repeat-containing protein [Alphaproteobacteria bacterium]|nr:VCBS repeat-containing protein [Alphaproteobacteria bacterium]